MKLIDLVIQNKSRISKLEENVSVQFNDVENVLATIETNLEEVSELTNEHTNELTGINTRLMEVEEITGEQIHSIEVIENDISAINDTLSIKDVTLTRGTSSDGNLTFNLGRYLQYGKVVTVHLRINTVNGIPKGTVHEMTIPELPPTMSNAVFAPVYNQTDIGAYLTGNVVHFRANSDGDGVGAGVLLQTSFTYIAI